MEIGVRRKLSIEEDIGLGKMLCVFFCGGSERDGGEGVRMEVGLEEDRIEIEFWEGKGLC